MDSKGNWDQRLVDVPAFDVCQAKNHFQFIKQPRQTRRHYWTRLSWVFYIKKLEPLKADFNRFLCCVQKGCFSSFGQSQTNNPLVFRADADKTPLMGIARRPLHQSAIFRKMPHIQITLNGRCNLTNWKYVALPPANRWSGCRPTAFLSTPFRWLKRRQCRTFPQVIHVVLLPRGLCKRRCRTEGHKLIATLRKLCR